MSEYKSNLRITDLPPELVRKCCDFMEVPHLLNSCIGIRQWNWILETVKFSRKIEDYICHLPWVDKTICEVLFPTDAEHGSRERVKAVQHHEERKWRHSEAIIPQNVDADFIYAKLFCAPEDCTFCIPINYEDVFPYTCDLIEEIHLNDKMIRGYSRVIRNTHRLDDDFTKLRSYCTMLAVERRRCGQYGCIIYFVEPMQFDETELKFMLRSMWRQQTLIIALVVDISRGQCTEFDHFLHFLSIFGGWKNSPLATAPSDWVLWCVRREGNRFVNLGEILRFAYGEVMSKLRP